MYIYNVIINRVIDGDSVKVDIDLGFSLWVYNQNIRLFGLDAPETRTTDKIEKQFGNKTKETVESFLPVGHRCEMISVEKRGKFGRILGEFLVDDPDGQGKMNLNRYLIENKLAVAYTGQFNRHTLRDLHKENRRWLIEHGVMKINGTN